MDVIQGGGEIPGPEVAPVVIEQYPEAPAPEAVGVPVTPEMPQAQTVDGITQPVAGQEAPPAPTLQYQEPTVVTPEIPVAPQAPISVAQEEPPIHPVDGALDGDYPNLEGVVGLQSDLVAPPVAPPEQGNIVQVPSADPATPVAPQTVVEQAEYPLPQAPIAPLESVQTPVTVVTPDPVTQPPPVEITFEPGAPISSETELTPQQALARMMAEAQAANERFDQAKESMTNLIRLLNEAGKDMTGLPGTQTNQAEKGSGEI